MADLSSRGISAFSLVADVSAAHRRVKVLRRDWPLMVCALGADDLWLNCVGTFGVSSAGYWFARLTGGPTRVALSLLQPSKLFVSVVR